MKTDTIKMKHIPILGVSCLTACLTNAQQIKSVILGKTLAFCIAKTKQVINVRILSPSIYPLFLMFLFISPFSGFAQELNLGFEQTDTKTGLPLGWSPEKDMEQCFSLDSVEKRSGKYALHITSPGNDKILTASYTFPCNLPQGITLKYKYWVKTKYSETNAQSKVFIFMGFSDNKNSIVGAGRENLSEQWVQYSFQEKIPIPTKELEISIGLSHTQGEMWIDDVSLFLDDKEITNSNELFLTVEDIDDTIDPYFAISPYSPVKKEETGKKLSLIKMNYHWASLPADSIIKHPASAFFPGTTSSEVPRISRKVDIKHEVNPCSDLKDFYSDFRSQAQEIWYSTGLYAPAGEKITVRIPEWLKGKVSVQIGAHREDLTETMLTPWTRLPKLLYKKQLDAPTTDIATICGGLIYIVCPTDSDTFKAEIEINRAVEAPRYIRGKTTESGWRTELEKTGAPWGEFETDHLILTLPVSVLRKIEHLDKAAALWDSLIGAAYELAQFPIPPAPKMRIITDIQLAKYQGGAAGFCGYPIYLLHDYSKSVDSYSILQDPSRMNRTPTLYMSMAILHEIGHNVVNINYEFEGTTEVVNNLFVLYAYDRVFGNREGLPDSATEACSDKFFMVESLAEWRSNPWLGLMIFKQLQIAFGWEPFKSVFKKFNEDSLNKNFHDNQGKIDCWVDYFSEATGKNLAPYFEKWDINVSDSIKTKLKKYPVWMPAILTRAR